MSRYIEIYNAEWNTLNHWNETIIFKYYFRNKNYTYFWNIKKKEWRESSLNKEAAVVNNEHGWSIYNYRVSQRDWTVCWIAAKTTWQQTPAVSPWLLGKGFFCHNSNLKEVINTRVKHSSECYSDLTATKYKQQLEIIQIKFSQKNLGSFGREGKHPASNTDRLHNYTEYEEGPQKNAVFLKIWWPNIWYSN